MALSPLTENLNKAAHGNLAQDMVAPQRSYPLVGPLRSIACGLGWALLVASCSGSPPPLKTPRRIPTTSSTAPAPPKLPGPPALPALPLVQLPSSEIPFQFARKGDSGLIIASIDGKWLARSVPLKDPKKASPKDQALAQDGGAQDDPNATEDVHIGAAPDEKSPTALHPTGSGYLLSWVRNVEGYNELWARTLNSAGRPKGQQRQITRTTNPIVWVQISPSDRGPLLLWQERHNDTSRLSVAPYRRSTVASTPNVVAEAVLGWQTVNTDEGLAIAYVKNPSTGTASTSGTVQVIEVTQDAKVNSQTTLSSRPTALTDVQIVSLTDRYVVAWTDRGPEQTGIADQATDSHVYLGTVRHGGGRPTAASALKPVGSQVLVALVASADRKKALLAWERDLGMPLTRRLIHLNAVTADGQLARRRALVEFHSPTDFPHFTTVGSGFAALTLSPAILNEQHEDAAELNQDPPLAPTFVRFDNRLHPVGAEPVRLDEIAAPGIPDAMQDLACGKTTCTALATSETAAGQLLLVTIPSRSSPWRIPARTIPADAPPQAVALGTVATVNAPVADLATAPLVDGQAAVAWVTHVSPLARKDRRKSQPEATLAVRFVAPGPKLSPLNLLSERAISMGGVSVAAIPTRTGDKRPHKPMAIVGWTGPNNGDAQVFLTTLAADGTKLRQRAITAVRRRAAGAAVNSYGVANVEVVADGQQGFIAAWVDTRNGNSEIYAAKISRALTKRGTDKRITSSPGNSTEVKLLVRGDRTFAVWADDREDPKLGSADIYLAQLDTKTLKKRGPETRLFRSEAHSRTPGIAGAADGLVIWWLEEPVAQKNPNRAGLRVLRLDGQGRPRGAARLVKNRTNAPVTSAVIGCGATHCRGLLSDLVHSTLRFGAFTESTGAGGSSTAAQQPVKSIATLGGYSVQDISLVADRPQLESIFFVHDHPRRLARIRYLRLRW